MTLGGALAASLARVLHKALESAAGLVVTGGETAANLMAEVGIHGIRLVAEVESGVPAVRAVRRMSGRKWNNGFTNGLRRG